MLASNRPPEGYPIFEETPLGKEQIFDKDVYLVDRSGRVCLTTTTNRNEYENEFLRHLNIGYIRARYLTNEGDFLTYTNQLRMATKEEIKKTKEWIKNWQIPYKVEANGQLSLF